MADVTEVADGVYEIAHRAGAIRLAQWAVRGERSWLVIDAGLSASPRQELVPALERIGVDRVAAILLSHADVDHAGGVAELTAALGAGTPVLAHRDEAAMLGSWPELFARRYAWSEPHGLSLEPAAVAWMQEAYGRPAPVEALEDGAVIDLGRRSVQVVLLGGHSPGLLGAHITDAGVLIAPDAAFGRGPDPADPGNVTPPQYEDGARYRTALSRIAELDPSVLGACHYAPLRGGDLEAFLDDSARFADDVDRVIADTLEAGGAHDLAALTARADVLGPFRPDFFEAHRSVAGQADEAVTRGRARRDDASTPPTWSRA